MRVAVLGAGVIGVATAYELWRDGHEVVVVDRGSEPANATSFGNAGMIAPGHAYAWSSPKAMRTLARALWRDDLALRFRFQADPQFWRWCWRFARQCTSERAAYNTARKVALCLYSQRRLHAVVADTGVAYGAPRRAGHCISTATAEGLARAAATAQILRDQGVEVRAVDAGRGGGDRSGLRSRSATGSPAPSTRPATRAATRACSPAASPTGWRSGGSSSASARPSSGSRRGRRR